jgi:hypothetical protein
VFDSSFFYVVVITVTYTTLWWQIIVKAIPEKTRYNSTPPELAAVPLDSHVAWVVYPAAIPFAPTVS